MESLRRGAERSNQRRTLGFFLDLTAQLSGEKAFKQEASRLHARARLTTEQFFRPTTKRERQLAEMKTPEIARRWGFRMNMDLDSFASMFGKGSLFGPAAAKKVGRRSNKPR